MDDTGLEDVKLFDTSDVKIAYSRTKDTKRVTVAIHSETGIGELRLYLILCMEIEKLERRLGIFNSNETIN